MIDREVLCADLARRIGKLCRSIRPSTTISGGRRMGVRAQSMARPARCSRDVGRDLRIRWGRQIMLVRERPSIN